MARYEIIRGRLWLSQYDVYAVGDIVELDAAAAASLPAGVVRRAEAPPEPPPPKRAAEAPPEPTPTPAAEAEPEPEPPPELIGDLDDMTVAELEAYAATVGVGRKRSGERKAAYRARIERQIEP